MKKDLCKIKQVESGSIAEEVGIEPGDWLISMNGEKVKDVFDYRFFMTNEELVLEIQKSQGDVWEIEIEKDEYEDLGLEFASSMMDDAKNCKNNCVFCFIDQLPKGLRETLYFKDDDSRLSFLTGNYVTLTNMDDQDIERIIRYKMSPINVSVHTTNPDLRILMLKNKFAGSVTEKIRKLLGGGISINCQIVLCQGLNDGMELDRTISDLIGICAEAETKVSFEDDSIRRKVDTGSCACENEEFVFGIKSISVVPVGLTRFREGLCDLKPYDATTSILVLDQIALWQKQLLEKFNSRLLYPADEFFILAGVEIPDYEYYEDFPQIENGVGLMAMLQHEFNEALKQIPSPIAYSPWPVPRTLSIATGISAASFINNMAEVLKKGYNMKVNVFAIKNNFFGENVTVTGLLTGTDIISQLKGKDLGEELLLCESMFKSGENLFLDDYTLEQVEKELNVKVTIVENSGKDFIDKVLRINGGQ